MIITSMSVKGFNEYGKRSIESWLEHTPFDITIYYEDAPFDFGDEMRIEQKPLYHIGGVEEFYEHIQTNPRFKGLFEDDNGKEFYNYMYDVNKFSRKTFAVTDFGLSYKKPFCWMDADVIATKPLENPEEWLTTLLDGQYLAYLGRQWSYSECGFMAFDPSHPSNKLVMNLMKNCYLNGTFTQLNYWTDCHVFDAVRTIVGVPCNNLAEGLKTNHPFIESVLGKNFDHLKGPERKKIGHSPELMEKTA